MYTTRYVPVLVAWKAGDKPRENSLANDLTSNRLNNSPLANVSNTVILKALLFSKINVYNN